MIKPRLMTDSEKAFNDKVWELRIKYNDFIDFDEDMNDSIVDQPEDIFKRVTKQFDTPLDYLKAVTIMSNYINEAQEVPPELYEKIKRTREDFKRYFEQNN